MIAGVKYAPLADALDTAEANDVVEIIKDQVTAVTDATLKKDVQLKSNGRTFVYKGNVDSKIDVAEDGMVTVTGGNVNVTGDIKGKKPGRQPDLPDHDTVRCDGCDRAGYSGRGQDTVCDE